MTLSIWHSCLGAPGTVNETCVSALQWAEEGADPGSGSSGGGQTHSKEEKAATTEAGGQIQGAKFVKKTLKTKIIDCLIKRSLCIWKGLFSIIMLLLVFYLNSSSGESLMRQQNVLQTLSTCFHWWRAQGAKSESRSVHLQKSTILPSAGQQVQYDPHLWTAGPHTILTSMLLPSTFTKLEFVVLLVGSCPPTAFCMYYPASW